MHNIVCVVVTYNRLEKLKKALTSYDSQTMSFDTLVIVDNNSTDGTSAYLKEWEKVSSPLFNKHVIYLPENRGGSGGFYEGEKYAMTLNPDWIYVADDDAYPEENLIEKYVSYIGTHQTDNISALCSSVISPNGTISLQHRSRHQISRYGYFEIIPVPQEEYEGESFDLTLLSYVGALMNAVSLKKVGFVNPEFFIYCDDAEHSLRLCRVGKILCLPHIIVTHDSGEHSESNDIIVSWRDYYLIRNQMYTFSRYSLYAGFRMMFEFYKCVKKAPWIKQKLYIKAVFDGLFGVLKCHKVYKPGWNITCNNI